VNGFDRNRKPWQSNEERLVDDAIESQLAPERVIAAKPTSVPGVVLFPARVGYGDMVERTPTILDAINTDRRVDNYRRDFSGGPGSYSGSSVNQNPLG